MRIWIALAVLATAAPAYGQRAISVHGDAGLGSVSDAFYGTVQAGVDITEGALAVGIFARVRFAFADDENDGPIRERDYDEVTDYLRILRYLKYRRSFGDVTIDGQAGELLGVTLGHGAILRDYSNVSDPDHGHSGLRLKVDYKQFALEALVDNYVSPGVLAARASFATADIFRGLRIGATAFMDPQAPVAADTDSLGRRRVSETHALVTNSEAMGILGVDVEYRFGGGGNGELTPYADLNTTFTGVGLHLGARGSIPLSRGKLKLLGWAEYRIGSEKYVGSYASTFYDIDRFQAGLSFSDPADASAHARGTKLASLKNAAYGGSGFSVEGGLDAGRRLLLKAGFSLDPGPDANRLWVRLLSSPVDPLSVGALVVVRGVGDGDESGLAVMAEARYRVAENFYAVGQFMRSWALKQENGYFAPLTVFNVGVGGSWSR